MELKPDYTRYDGPVHPQAREKQAYVEGMFDAVAPTYDRANLLMSFGLESGWRRRLLRESGAGPSSAVLDVGCGTGRLLMDFARRGLVGRGEGVDLSAGMLAVAKRDDRWNLDWQQGSALQLPKADAQYDAVVSAWVLRSITDPGRFFQEMARVAKPGGRVLVLELTRPRSAWLRAVYWPFLNVYVPVMGRLVSGHKDGYRYLRDTINGFYGPGVVLDHMARAGLTGARALPLTLGVATLFIAEKP
ncbi:MAG TPA: ubiquinone/menaquinone biosynthesis methyltransferase [bacterium]|jgi:demethylmenaquinone methyltransferase/2-methoxy-6-polyprenyl-1,4-benzoquinol methylase|nr:ubiquinone/menaquinone biosynthesis methyltransferase [bacterium]HXB98704.1 ubiquinone/menaquinone biosynthesis methyltransferase [bacterium]